MIYSNSFLFYVVQMGGFLPTLAHERATSTLFQASAFASRSFLSLFLSSRPSPPRVITSSSLMGRLQARKRETIMI